MKNLYMLVSLIWFQSHRLKQNLTVGFPPKGTYSIKLVGSPIFDMHTHLYHHLTEFSFGCLVKYCWNYLNLSRKFARYNYTTSCILHCYRKYISCIAQGFSELVRLSAIFWVQYYLYFFLHITFPKELKWPPSMVDVTS